MPAFENLLVVVAVAFAAPFVLGLVPSLGLPSVVVEIAAGIAVGPAGLGLVEADGVVEAIALIGLAFVLFLAGLEIELERLRGPVLRLAGLGFLLSFGLAVAVAAGLQAAGLVDTPLLVAIILCATSLGVLIPVLKDAGEIASPFGQLVVAAATIADFGAIILLSVFFSGEGGAAERSPRIRADLLRGQDTTAQLRVRAALVLLIGFAAAADGLGLEVILGAFVAGVVLTLVDRDEAMTHPALRRKLEAIGFGLFIPVFFVTTGVRFDIGALTASTSALALVPVFLAALLVVRGAPALLYLRVLDRRRVAVAGLLQATSLPFIVAAATIGVELGRLDGAQSAALIGAGLLSVLLFPLGGLTLLRADDGRDARGSLPTHPEPDIPYTLIDR